MRATHAQRAVLPQWCSMIDTADDNPDFSIVKVTLQSDTGRLAALDAVHVAELAAKYLATLKGSDEDPKALEAGVEALGGHLQREILDRTDP